jgi:hypothetical protein
MTQYAVKSLRNSPSASTEPTRADSAVETARRVLREGGRIVREGDGVYAVAADGSRSRIDARADTVKRAAGEVLFYDALISP